VGRLGLVFLAWIVFVGGLGLYMHRRDAGRTSARAAVTLPPAAGRYTVEVTPTFRARPDPFALRTETSGDAPALRLRLDTREILHLTDGVEAGRPVVVEDLEGLVEGPNELYLEASPPTDETARRHFVQLRVLRDGRTVAEEVFWSEGGAQVAGSLRFVLAPPAEDDHEH
jgi:hypothetical protein